MEMAWITKMMIGKVISETKDARREDNKELKKMLEESLSHINSLETITKLLVEAEKDQKSKLERLAAQFHLYLHYVHHMEITPTENNNNFFKTKKINYKNIYIILYSYKNRVLNNICIGKIQFDKEFKKNPF
jgi:hypothetical protein